MQTGTEEAPVTVHVEDPRRWISLLLALILIAAVVLVLFGLSGATEPVPVGRS
jgi:hypothetical protein